MKVIVGGSRTIEDFRLVARAIVESGLAISEVVSGASPGVDRLGERYAEERGIPVRRFRADWRRHGRGAGRKLNEALVAYADALIAVHNGSRGTEDAIRRMRAAG
jgi:hypothetical protein